MKPPALSKVLCVDDEPALLRALRMLLRAEFDVVVAQDGVQALAMLNAERFDVILSDQRMPGMSGAEFLKQAKVLAPHSMRLLLTGHADFSAVVSALNEGDVFRFISKPWDNHKLVQAVQEAARLARMSRMGWSDFQDTIAQDPAQPLTGEVLLVQADTALIDACTHACQGLAALQVAHDAADALTMLAQRRFPAVVIQQHHSAGDTAALVRSIKRRRPRLSVVICSAHPDIQALQCLINEGQINRYVTLPTDEAYLRISIEGALQRHAELNARPALLAEARQRRNAILPEPPAHVRVMRQPRTVQPSWWRRLLGWR
jgi:DNA-binding NtrC family response regulator